MVVMGLMGLLDEGKIEGRAQARQIATQKRREKGVHANYQYNLHELDEFKLSEFEW